jgi:type IV pilus assembly protein PilE
MRRQQGFTLIEVMIVTVIIAILASIAIPSYTSYITRGKIAEATTNLSDLRVKMEQSYQDNRKYGTGGACGVTMPATTANGNIKYFTFSCASANANTVGDQTYTLTATGTDPALQGFAYTINQANNKATTIAAPADTGKWGTGAANCWISKPQSC